MNRTLFGGIVPLLSAALAVAPAAAQDPGQIVARAARAMGGDAALRSVRVTSVTYYSMVFGIGQSEAPESPPRATMATGTVLTDWQNFQRLRSVEARSIVGQVTRNVRVTSGGIGMVSTDGREAPDAPGQVINAERQMRREPERLILAALDNPGALASLPPRAFRGEMMDGVRFALGADTLSLYFDRGTGRLVVAEVLADDPILGDRRTATMYTRWQPAGSILLPRQIDVTVNGQTQEHTIITAASTPVQSDGPPSAFAIADSIRSRAQRVPPAPPAVAVSLVELAPGVWRAEGGTHHSLIVEQPGQLVMIEAPQSAARTQAVLDTLRARFPAKAVGLVVNSHHHWDHAGGVRTIIGAGLPIVTHARNGAFVRQIAAAPKTVAPDEQARRRRTPTLRLFEDSMVIGSGTSQVVLYAIPTVHVEGILAAWVPSARVVFTADVMNPAATLAPAGSAELVAFARSRGIQPERYAGGHGVVVNWPDIERAAQAAR